MVTSKFSFNKIVRFLDTRYGQRLVIITGGVVFGIAAAVGVYHWHMTSLNERAQKAFMEGIAEFEQALLNQQGMSWSNVERTFEAGAHEFSRSSLAPYFTVFQADAVLQQEKHDAAIALLKEAISKMSSSKNPLYYLYRTKLALMLVDSQESALHDEGTMLLKELADTSVNSYRDMALYYLGFYARMNEDQAAVQTYWSRLVQEFGADSVWSELVKAQRDFTV